MPRWPYTSLGDRFWSGVRRGDVDDCWIWTRSCGKSGYGHLWVNGQYVDAHRVSWVLTHGPVPAHQIVLHDCDNKRCVNPRHLSLGTYQRNTQDWHDRHPVRSCRLTREQTAEMLRLYATGRYTQDAVGAMYGVSGKMVSLILHGMVYQRYRLAHPEITAARKVGEASVSIRATK